MVRWHQPADVDDSLEVFDCASNVCIFLFQNVDRLHQRAGAEDVLELHGTIHEAECLECGIRENRVGLQERLETLNPAWKKFGDMENLTERPDGDIDLPGGLNYSHFEIPPCLREILPNERRVLSRSGFALCDSTRLVLSHSTVVRWRRK